MSEDKQAEWKVYRQKLRDLPGIQVAANRELTNIVWLCHLHKCPAGFTPRFFYAIICEYSMVKTMPQFTLICTDEDSTVTTKEFEATVLEDVVNKTEDFLKGVGYCFEELHTLKCTQSQTVTTIRMITHPFIVTSTEIHITVV